MVSAASTIRAHRRWVVLATLGALLGLLALAPSGSALPTRTGPTPTPAPTPAPAPAPNPAPTPTTTEPADPTPTPTPTETSPDPKPSPQPGPAPVAPGTEAKDPDKLKDPCQKHFYELPSTECMTQKAVKTIFGISSDGWITKPALKWLIHIPPFVSDTSSTGIGNAEWLSEAIAFALLLSVATFTFIHYWAVGMTSQGGSTMLLDGLMRCVGAALFILAWPFIFTNAANITNQITALLIPAEAINNSLLAITGAGAVFGAGMGSIAAAIMVAIAFLIMFMGLLVIKIGLTSGLVVAFLGVPIAVGGWPLPFLAGPALYALRFCGMVFTVMILWALSFKAFGSINSEFLSWGSHLGVADKIVLPLMGLGQLGVLIAATRHSTTMWNIASGRGPVGQAAGMALLRGLGRLLSGLGGRTPKTPPTPTRHRAQIVRPTPAINGRPVTALPAGRQTPALPAVKTTGKQLPPTPKAIAAPAPAGNGKRPSTAAATPAKPPRVLSNAERDVRKMRSTDQPTPRATRAAIDRASARYGGDGPGALHRFIGADGGGHEGSTRDETIVRTMSKASSASGLLPADQTAFRTIGAATPATRQAAMELSPAIPMPPAPSPSPSPPSAPSPSPSPSPAGSAQS